MSHKIPYPDAPLDLDSNSGAALPAEIEEAYKDDDVTPADIDHLVMQMGDMFTDSPNHPDNLAQQTEGDIDFAQLDLFGGRNHQDVPQVAARDNAGKLSMHYPKLFPKCAALITMVFESGEVKYDYKNFLLGGKPDREYQDSFSRHEIKLYSGLEYDVGTRRKPGSRCHHLGLMLSNLMMWVENNLEWDQLHMDGLAALKGLEDLYIAAGFLDIDDEEESNGC